LILIPFFHFLFEALIGKLYAAFIIIQNSLLTDFLAILIAPFQLKILIDENRSEKKVLSICHFLSQFNANLWFIFH
jgi:hypothetical protein